MGEELIFTTKEEADTWAAAFQTFATVEAVGDAERLADQLIWAMRERKGEPHEGWKAANDALIRENEILIAAFKAHGIEADEIESASVHNKLAAIAREQLEASEAVSKMVDRCEVLERQLESAKVKLEQEREATSKASTDNMCKLVEADTEAKKGRKRIEILRGSLDAIKNGGADIAKVLDFAREVIRLDDRIESGEVEWTTIGARPALINE